MRDGPHQQTGPGAADEGSSSWRHRGFVLDRGLLDADAAQLSSWADEILRDADTHGEEVMLYREDGADRDGPHPVKRVENSYARHTRFRRLLDEGMIRARASELLEAPAIMFKDKLVVRNPGSAGFPPHQDHFGGWWPYGDCFVTAAIAIEPATPENGCIEFPVELPRDGCWKGELPLTVDRLAALDYQPVPTKPGDVIFFHGHAPHRSRPNPTGTRRRVLYATYNRSTDGDMRTRYFADLREGFPPDCEREPGRHYAYPLHPAISAGSPEGSPG